MRWFPNLATPAILSGIAMALSVPALIEHHPYSLASQVLGTDDAFATSGLHLRERIGVTPIRWTRRKASFEFGGLNQGLVGIDLMARDHITDVTVLANGAIIGMLPIGHDHFASTISLTGGSLVLETITDGFVDHGRTLGTQFLSLRVEPRSTPLSGPGSVPRRLWIAMGVTLLASFLTQALSGLAVWIALLPPVLHLALVVPAGLWRSRWLIESTILIALVSAVSALVVSRTRGTATERAWLQAALVIGLTVHGVLPPSPLVKQGDVQMHGHKLGQLALGNLFPTSLTDHRPPFEIPYGFSFYGMLRPWASSDLSNVSAVRTGAALFSSLSLLALALALGRGSASLAGASAILWAFSPVNIQVMGFGNLSNVFGQSTFVLFLVAAHLVPKGSSRSVLLFLLAAVSATAHLSSFIVLLTLTMVASLISPDRRDPAFRSLFAGTALASAYYATFLPIIVAQVPRLLGEHGGSVGVFDPWRLPAQVVAGAGWPLLALMVVSYLTGTVRPALPLSRSLAVTAVLLALAGLFSPVEVRYLLAVLPLLAIVGGSVFDATSWPVAKPWLRALGLGLLVASIIQGLVVLQEFMPLSRV